MLQNVLEGLHWALGLGVETKQLTVGHLALRTIMIFIVGLVIVRLGNKRFLGRSTAFDALLAVVLGSVLGRAINGSAPFFPTLGASLVLVGLHWLFAALAFRSDRFGRLVKGDPRTLIQDGEIQWAAMQKSHITKHDLVEALRTNAKLSDPGKVQLAHLERSGDISAIPCDHQPHVVEIAVEAGVQTVRLEL